MAGSIAAFVALSIRLSLAAVGLVIVAVVTTLLATAEFHLALLKGYLPVQQTTSTLLDLLTGESYPLPRPIQSPRLCRADHDSESDQDGQPHEYDRDQHRDHPPPTQDEAAPHRLPGYVLWFQNAISNRKAPRRFLERVSASRDTAGYPTWRRDGSAATVALMSSPVAVEHPLLRGDPKDRLLGRPPSITSSTARPVAQLARDRVAGEVAG